MIRTFFINPIIEPDYLLFFLYYQSLMILFDLNYLKLKQFYQYLLNFNILNIFTELSVLNVLLKMT